MGQRQRDAVKFGMCDADAFQNEIDQYTYKRTHKILPNDFGYTLQTPVKEILCTCKQDRVVLRKLLPTNEFMNDVTCYPSCPRILFTAFMRQLRQPVNAPNQDTGTIQRYTQFCQKFFLNKIEPLLQNFTYHIEAWINHLETYNKQIEVMPYYLAFKRGIKSGHSWYDDTYTLFAKKEKQIVEVEGSNVKMPKCRAISSCPPNLKWILGPITIALEKLLHGKLHGYKMRINGEPAKTWQQQEETYNMKYSEGMQTNIDIDGSAWDSTQVTHMKTLPRLIYNYLADNDLVKHVDVDLFTNIVNKQNRRLVAKSYINKRTVNIFSAIVDETMFSGSPGTTLENTVANLSVTHFIMEELNIPEDAYELSCSGDDTQLLIKHEYLKTDIQQRIMQYWQQLGLMPKYVKVGGYDTITYCSTNVIPYKDKETRQQKFKIVRALNRMNPLGHWTTECNNYSAQNLKHYYIQLAKGYEYWANNMPFYSSYQKAYSMVADRIHGSPIEAKPGKAKLNLPTLEHYEADNEKTKYMNRKSTSTPDEQSVLNFLLDHYGYSKSDIQEIEYQLLNNNTFIEQPTG